MDEKTRAAIRHAQYKYNAENQKKYRNSDKGKEYLKRWKAEHPEKQKEYLNRFYLKKAVEYGYITPEEADGAEFNNSVRNKTIRQYQANRHA